MAANRHRRVAHYEMSTIVTIMDVDINSHNTVSTIQFGFRFGPFVLQFSSFDMSPITPCLSFPPVPLRVDTDVTFCLFHLLI